MKWRVGILIVIVFLVTEAIKKQESLTLTPSPEITQEVNDSFLLGTWIVSDEKTFLTEYLFDEKTLTVVCKYEQEDYKSSYNYKVLDEQLYLSYLGEEINAGALQRTSDDILCIVDEKNCVKLYRKNSKVAQEMLKIKEDYWIGDWVLVDENFEPVSHWNFKSKEELVCKNPGEQEKRINYKSIKSDGKIKLTIDKKLYEMQRKYARIYISDGENEYTLIEADSTQFKEFMELIKNEEAKNGEHIK